MGRPISDHLGNSYPSLVECAKAYGLTGNTLRQRLKRNWTIREALVTPYNKVDAQNISDTSLNPLIAIHEYSHTVQVTGERNFRVTVVETGEIKYLTEYQVKHSQVVNGLFVFHCP